MIDLQSPHFFKLFTRAYPGLMSYISRDYTYAFVSDQYREWFGVDPATLIGVKVSDVLGEEAFYSRKDHMDRCFQGEQVVFQSQLHHKSLGLRATEQVYYPDVNDAGEVLGLFALAQDVTERLENERKVKEADARIRKLLDEQKEQLFSLLMQSPAMITVISGPELIIDFQNVKAQEYVKRSLLGKSLREEVPELEQQGFFKMMDEIFDTGKSVSITASPVSVRDTQGQVKLGYFDLFYEPMRDESGKVVSIFNLAIEVTDQVTAFRHAEESQKLFRTYAESMPHMAYIANPQGEIIYYNKQWEAYTGINPYNTKGENIIIHPDDYLETDTKWNEAVASGTLFQMEERLLGKDKTYRWHLSRAVPIRDSEGQITKWMGTVTDIHEVKNREHHLESALRTRDEFLSIASHELKTPLTSLKLQAQLFLRSLKKGDPLAVSQERLTNMANQSNELVSRLSRLIDDMLDVSRIRTGRLTLDKSSEDLYEISKSVVEGLEVQFLAAGIETPSIRGSESVEGEWDRYRIEQVLGNLLTNAIRYGQGKPISLEVRKIADKAELRVTDQGYGISKEDQKRIFDRFERAIDASEVSGMGLGLFITKEIVRAHGGEIGVESEPGHGATFIVTLPLKS